MFWNDIKEIKEMLSNFSSRIGCLEDDMTRLSSDIYGYEGDDESRVTVEDLGIRLNQVIDSVENIEKVIPNFFSEEPGDVVRKYADRIEKLDDNMRRLNDLVNEIKGCAAMCRPLVKESANEIMSLSNISTSIGNINAMVHKIDDDIGNLSNKLKEKKKEPKILKARKTRLHQD